ncbi:MAG: hypothetical protein LC117_05785 [Bacteroidia bacterium]|nr:hypothetical protein [Bacteroidia bacterium]MCZ2277422.1 hypothetical protein [Bacteroidia bacterium]
MNILNHQEENGFSSITNEVKAMNMSGKLFKIFFLLLFIFNYSAYSQTYSVLVSELNGKYGVKNNKGEMILPEKYASIVLLSDNSFLVYEDNPGWPMIINQKGDILVSKTNHIGKVLDTFNNHFICQYYKDGKMADLVLFKAPDMVLYNFPIKYIHAEFVKDSCYTYVSAQTLTPGEKLAIDMNGLILTGPDDINFNYIKELFKPCNGYAVVLKNKGYEGILSGVYDLNNKKMIIPCNFSDVAFDKETGLIKAYDKVKTLTYNLYDTGGQLVKTWEQIKK